MLDIGDIKKEIDRVFAIRKGAFNGGAEHVFNDVERAGGGQLIDTGVIKSTQDSDNEYQRMIC